MKSALMFAAAALVSVTFIGGAATPAEAKIHCQYYAKDTSNRLVYGTATHKKGSTACKRAHDRCERRLKRARSKGLFGRSAAGTHNCEKGRTFDV